MSAWLAGVCLTSPDVHRLSQFYVDALGYDGGQTGAAWRGTLCGRWLEIHEGSANALDHAVFAVSSDADLSSLKGRLGTAGVLIEEIGAAGMSGSIKFSDPDGNKLIFGVATPAAADAPGESMAATLQHIVYASDEVTTQLRFYCDIVGFAASDFVTDENGDLSAVFLRCSEAHHSLAIFRASRKRLDHFCYEVGDWGHIRDWADRFAERRMKLSWGPGRHGPGNNLFLFVNDPDGNWLEFSAELERVIGARPVKRWAHEERTLNSWGSAPMRS